MSLSSASRAPDAHGCHRYVLDGVPPGDFDMTVLCGEETTTPLSFIIEVQSDDEAVISALGGFRLDPTSGLLYSMEDLTQGDHQPLVEAVNADDPTGAPPTNEDGSAKMVRWSPPAGFADKLVRRACDVDKLAKTRIDSEWHAVIKTEGYALAQASVLPHHCFVLDGKKLSLSRSSLLRTC